MTKILLPAQQCMLEDQIERGPDAPCELIWRAWPEICVMVRRRHAAGYTIYGDTMYHWPDKVRTQNALEEAADLVVYMSSGGWDVGLC